MTAQNKALVRRALDDVFAGGDLAAVNEVFHPRFINHEAGPRTPPGPEGLKVTVSWLRRSFSELHYDIEDVIEEGDKVVARVISSGRHTGEFIGFAPTGKRFSVEQIHIYRIEDGKIIEHWSSRDDLSQGMQLGFIPGGRPAVQETTPTVPSVRRSEIPVRGGKILTADRMVITQPSPGVFRAFSATCTHMGCTVGEVAGGVIRCPCHGSEFSIEDGSVKHGPAAQPLPQYGVHLAGDQVNVTPTASPAATRSER